MENNPSLQSVETKLKNLKNILKGSYKTLRNGSTNDNETDNLLKQFNSIYGSIENIHQESFKLDNEKIWEKILTHTDSNTFEEFEKQTYDQFICITQLLRGTLNGLSTIKNTINYQMINNYLIQWLIYLKMDIVYFQTCYANYLSPLCLTDSSLIAITLFLSIMSYISFIQMSLYFRRLKFENIVILNGIVQLLIAITVILTKYEFILEIGFFIHIFTLSNIIRRFLHLSTNINQSSQLQAYCHKIVFVLINIINCAILILCLLSTHINQLIHLKLLIEIAYRTYVFIITLILVITGLIILRILSQSKPDKDSNDTNKYIKEQNTIKNSFIERNPTKIYKETYYGKRKQQIITLIIINIITSVYQVSYTYMKNYYLEDEHFNKENHLTIMPMTHLAITIYSVYIFTFLLSVLVNYITFYWVIKKEFTEKIGMKRETSLSDSDIQRYSNDSPNDDLNSFLKKSMAKSNYDSLILE